MEAPIIKCIFAGPILEEISNNYSKDDYIEISAHLIMENDNIEVIIDEIIK